MTAKEARALMPEKKKIEYDEAIHRISALAKRDFDHIFLDVTFECKQRLINEDYRVIYIDDFNEYKISW